MRILPFGRTENRSLGSPLLRRYKAAEALWRKIVDPSENTLMSSVQILLRAQEQIPTLKVITVSKAELTLLCCPESQAAYVPHLKAVLIPDEAKEQPEIASHEILHVTQDLHELIPPPPSHELTFNNLHHICLRMCLGESNEKTKKLVPHHA